MIVFDLLICLYLALVDVLRGTVLLLWTLKRDTFTVTVCGVISITLNYVFMTHTATEGILWKS